MYDDDGMGRRRGETERHRRVLVKAAGGGWEGVAGGDDAMRWWSHKGSGLMGRG